MRVHSKRACDEHPRKRADGVCSCRVGGVACCTLADGAGSVRSAVLEVRVSPRRTRCSQFLPFWCRPSYQPNHKQRGGLIINVCMCACASASEQLERGCLGACCASEDGGSRSSGGSRRAARREARREMKSSLAGSDTMSLKAAKKMAKLQVKFCSHSHHNNVCILV